MPPAPPSNWKPIIVELWNLIHNEGWADDFQTAVQEARSYDVPEMRDITNTLDYCNFMNDLLSWVPTESQDGRAVYLKICMSYFILDQPSLIQLQSQIQPTSADKPLTTLSRWIVKYARSIGKDWLDTPASITPESIESFYNAPSYNMDDYIQPDGGWDTFNDFFARHLKPGRRPIDSQNDPAVIVSPADSTFDGYWSINDGLVDFGTQVNVKGVPWKIADLLQGSKYATDFKNGKFMHSFLNTNDYHRQHAPVAGQVVEAFNIEGAAYLEVVVKDEENKPVSFMPHRPFTNSSNHRFVMQRKILNPAPTPIVAPTHGLYRELEALDMPGYQFLQLRGCIVLDTAIGLVAVLPIGMAQVSSVVITCKVEQVLNKGDEISYFQFGGSDIVVVFQEGCQLDLTAEVGKHYNMGKAIGTGKIPSRT